MAILIFYSATETEINDYFASGRYPDDVNFIDFVYGDNAPYDLLLSNNITWSIGWNIQVNRRKLTLQAILPDALGNPRRARFAQPIPSGTTNAMAIGRWNPEISRYRESGELSFTSTLDTGGVTGTQFGGDLVFADKNGFMPDFIPEQTLTIMDSAMPDVVLWSGMTYLCEKAPIGPLDEAVICNRFKVIAQGWAQVADQIGIEEDPVFNVNAGAYLKAMAERYTTLDTSQIDTVNSPIVERIRLGNYKRFSELGKQLEGIWPGSQFYVENGKAKGIVRYSQRVSSNAPIVLDDALYRRLGSQNCKIQVDSSKQYNIVRYPYYREQWRDPDVFIQSTTTDTALLRTTVTLNGQPVSVDEADLLSEDFTTDGIGSDWYEEDKDNPTPPAGFTQADGYIIQGSVNGVTGLTMLNAGSVQLGELGRATDPTVIIPFTGEERQLICAKEVVINSPGDGMVLGIIDPTTYSTTITSVTSTSVFDLASTTGLVVGDRVTVDGENTYLTGLVGNTATVSPALTTLPQPTDVVIKHRLNLSRIKFGLLFKASGDLKYIRNGIEQAFSTPRTYAGFTTYSFRLVMQCFETTVASGATATGCTLTSATGFSTGDVVELFTLGSRSAPEKRTITVSGSSISYSNTQAVIKPGYRVRTLPKIVLQVKGGAYGSITGRDWTTIHTEANTWQSNPVTAPLPHGVLLCLAKSLTATISEFFMKNPIPVTANIGSRYLHIATQEADTSDTDVDCILRKVGSHYQLDLFPDTRALWASGSALVLNYKERIRYEFEDVDTQAMASVAMAKGYLDAAGMNEDQLRRLGGKTLPSIQPSPQAVTDQEAIEQSKAILNAVKDPAVTVSWEKDTYLTPILKSGQILRSYLPDVPDLTVQQIVLKEIKGAINPDTGAQLFNQQVTAGTLDKLQDVLQKRLNKEGRRVVVDDGRNDDSFTKVVKFNITDTVSVSDVFNLSECTGTSRIMTTNTGGRRLACLRIA